MDRPVELKSKGMWKYGHVYCIGKSSIELLIFILPDFLASLNKIFVLYLFL